jgi:Ca2+-binding EF-hand superfamily protein
MRAKLWIVVVLMISLTTLGDGLGQPPWGKDGFPKGKGPKGDKPPPSEDEKILKGIEKAYKPVETERDKLIKDMLKHYPQAREWLANAPGGPGDFTHWFDVLSGGQGVWRYDDIPHKPLRDMFERIAGRLGVADGQITRDQFVRYAQQYLVEGASPSWKSPAETGPQAEAAKTFRDLDRNGDGVLSHDEMSETLRAEWRRWDTNRDGFIDLNEYLDYFYARMRKVIAEGGFPGQPGPGRPPVPMEEANDSRPVVYRYGKLPPGIPAWFTQLDTDCDAQLGLYEWKYSGRPLGEFEAMDRNGDGFLTVTELVRFLKLQEQGQGGPFSPSLVSAGGSWGGPDGLPKGPKPKDPFKPPKEPKPKDPHKPPKEPKDFSKGPREGGPTGWNREAEPIPYPKEGLK